MRMPAEFFGGQPGDPPVWFRFLGCNPRHHSLALAPTPAKAGIIHLMIEVATLDDVGRALERCTRRKSPVAASLGRHANDLMVSFYARTPGGFDIEYGTDGRMVDDATWVSQGNDRGQPLGTQLCRPRRALTRRRRRPADVAPTDAAYRHVLGHFCTGVTVITGVDGATAPPGRVRLPGVRRPVAHPAPGAVLPGQDIERPGRRSRAPGPSASTCSPPASRRSPGGSASPAPDKFAGLSWSPSSSGAPVLAGALTWVECAVEGRARGRRPLPGRRPRHRARPVPSPAGRCCSTAAATRRWTRAATPARPRSSTPCSAGPGTPTGCSPSAFTVKRLKNGRSNGPWRLSRVDRIWLAAKRVVLRACPNV